MFARVKLVPVQFFSRSSSGGSEGNFSETPDFSHHVRCLLEGDDVDFISGFVGSSESAFRSEFCFEQIFLYGRYDWCHGVEMEGGRRKRFFSLFSFGFSEAVHRPCF